jgi:hypothetical protein
VAVAGALHRLLDDPSERDRARGELEAVGRLGWDAAAPQLLPVLAAAGAR